MPDARLSRRSCPIAPLARLILAFCLVGLLSGCMAEGSFPMVTERLVRLAPQQVEPPSGRIHALAWAAAAHDAARIRLPSRDLSALTTDDLAPTGQIAPVWRHFNLEPSQLDTLWHNWEGIEQTAAVSSPPPRLEGGHLRRSPWTGFRDIELPGANGAMLFARLGHPEPQHRIPGSAVIITHGLFGTLDGLDMENHVQALRRSGHVVLALEMRGHGETHCRHPEYAITFGMYEAGDLLSAAAWLRAHEGARRVGLVSFSLTGYESLLMAWLDGHQPVTDFDRSTIFSHLPRPAREPAFNGGLFIVSAPIGILSLAEDFQPRVNTLDAPCKATFQAHVARRLLFYDEPPAHGMWDLAKSEFTRAGFLNSPLEMESFRREFTHFVDFAADNWRIGAARMENIRVPVLVLHAANDPLATAQGVAELFGRVKNPNIGVILLGQGGHMGFSALSADYYYSLMVNFFDPATAPAVAPGPEWHAQQLP